MTRVNATWALHIVCLLVLAAACGSPFQAISLTPAGTGAAPDGLQTRHTPTSPPAASPATSSPAPSPAPTHAATAEATVAATPVPRLSQEAADYLNEVLDLMEAHALHSERLDWPALRAMAFATADGARTTADTYAAIRGVIARLRDNHSFLMEPQAVQDLQTGAGSAHVTRPTGTLLEDRIGRITIPGFAGSAEAVHSFADALQDLIGELDQAAPCGWIINLAGNTGGNMWPMLAGIGPLLGDGPVGAVVTPAGDVTYWDYRDGTAWQGDMAMVTASEPHSLQRGQPPVAVLLSSQTASSGEAIAVAFQGRPNTRSFGNPTRGLRTANYWFSLSDGAVLMLTTARYADRLGTYYGGQVLPDEIVPFRAQEAALRWLLNLPECQ